MEKIAGIMAKLRKVIPTIEKKYGVKYLEVFGSYVRGEQKKGATSTFWWIFTGP